MASTIGLVHQLLLSGAWCCCTEYNKSLGGLPGVLAALQQRAEHWVALAKDTLARMQVHHYPNAWHVLAARMMRCMAASVLVSTC